MQGHFLGNDINVKNVKIDDFFFYFPYNFCWVLDWHHIRLLEYAYFEDLELTNLELKFF